MIKPGASFVYRWTAEEGGTYFYHTHVRAQMMDGMYGSIVIENAPQAKRPFALISNDTHERKSMLKAEKHMQTLLISDWTRFTSSEFTAVEAAANVDLACMDAITVNGIGSEYCLSIEELDSMTHPVVLSMLHDLGEKHLTNKGCIPPFPVFQGDFDLHLENLPDRAYKKCIPGINPKGNFSLDVDTSVGYAAITFINPGSLYPLQVSIDSHDLHIFAVDGHYVHPQTVDRILVNTGSRISVMIKLDQKPANYNIRIANDYLNQVLGAFAELAYDGTSKKAVDAIPKMDFAGRPLNQNITSWIPEHSRPFPDVKPARHADALFRLTLKKLGRPHGAYEWTLTGKERYHESLDDVKNPNDPLLLSAPSDIPESELLLRTSSEQWVDVVLVTLGPFAQAHPMHKHGNRIFLIGSGGGDFPWKSVDEAMTVLPEGTFNLENPPYLDTFNTIEIQGGDVNATWTMVRYEVSAPGAWLFHCHVQTHLSGGMGMIILDGVDNFPEVPMEYQEWNGFKQTAVGWV